MTIVPIDPDGIARAEAALRAGEAILLPFASPLPYGVAATTPAAANGAKGRPHDQPCGMLVGDVDEVMAHVDLDHDAATFAGWVGEVERANLLLPLRTGAAAWLADHAAAGFAGVTFAWLAPLRALGAVGPLHVSSANPTAGEPAVTAPAADAAFDGRLLVLDGDALRDAGVPHGSATMVRFERDGSPRVVRDGSNNLDFAPDGPAYVASLRRRFSASRRGSAACSRSTPSAASGRS